MPGTRGAGRLHPWEGETEPNYTDFKENGKYSWCKAPRLDGKPVQVGPLAQILAAYAVRQRPGEEAGGRRLLKARHRR